MDLIKKVKQIQQLEKVSIEFNNYNSETEKSFKKVFDLFNKRHRLIIFKNKSLGVALIDLLHFNNFEEYIKSINGKNSAAYYSRKAAKRNYTFVKINRNDYIDDIYEINTSTEERQGRKMSNSYVTKVDKYVDEPAYNYFGVLDENGKLVSYCNIGFYGEFVLIAVLLGHKKHLNNGVMYFMITNLIQLIYADYIEKGYKYVMYDTFFGASEGLQQFKRKLGFSPYKVNWKWGK